MDATVTKDNNNNISDKIGYKSPYLATSIRNTTNFSKRNNKNVSSSINKETNKTSKIEKNCLKINDSSNNFRISNSIQDYIQKSLQDQQISTTQLESIKIIELLKRLYQEIELYELLHQETFNMLGSQRNLILKKGGPFRELLIEQEFKIL
ncbi:hypothetical protein O181_007161 [Austropuccinia psidii MF-1]|uniref:Uncharacterized protein n=1 Tax=Austropuccinia psidii MF-1 TaxID=1389203 RepID=A0A9Q3BKC0_9BASI|nr:hypothetical protein [Austropuccinia psidii MF-1]